MHPFRDRALERPEWRAIKGAGGRGRISEPEERAQHGAYEGLERLQVTMRIRWRTPQEAPTAGWSEQAVPVYVGGGGCEHDRSVVRSSGSRSSPGYPPSASTSVRRSASAVQECCVRRRSRGNRSNPGVLRAAESLSSREGSAPDPRTAP
jgi:hypothetical protein